MDRENIRRLVERWCGKLRITPEWSVQTDFVTDPAWRKTGDIKIDPDDRKAVLMLNEIDPK